MELIVWHANAVPIFRRRPCRLASKEGWPQEEGGAEAEVKGRDLGAAPWSRMAFLSLVLVVPARRVTGEGWKRPRGWHGALSNALHSCTRNALGLLAAPCCARWSNLWQESPLRGRRARGAAPPGPGGELDFLLPQPGATGWRRSQNPSRWHSCASRRARGLGAERLHLGWGGMRSETKQRLLPTLFYCCLWLALCVAKWPGRGQVPAAGTKRKGLWCAVCVASDFRALTLADAPSKF